MDFHYLTAHEIARLYRRRELSASEMTVAVFSRIEELEDRLHAYITLNKEQALAKAREVDEKLARGEELPPLAGIPVAIKDNICTRGLRTTCASKMLYNYIPPYNATVVEKLLAHDVVIIGKTNMDEFAMGSSTENSGFYPTANPWDTSRVPGGSSGGSAAAVASGEAVLALGSDTGGSIRQPAAFCGVVGLKPTYGAVSRFGLVAFASSLDQIGPLARDVTDCALLLQAIAGHDPQDSTSAPGPVPDYQAALRRELKGIKIGLPREYMGQGIDPAVRQVVEQAARQLADLGAMLEETTLPHIEYAVPAYYLIATAEASSNLARYDGVRYGLRSPQPADVVDMFMHTRSQGFGAEVKRRIMLGTYALSAGYYDAYYLRAMKVRTLIRQDLLRALEQFDCLLCPATVAPAFRQGEKVADPLQMYLADITTIPVNLAGLPGVALPAGQAGGLPVGIQLVGRPFGEDLLLGVAYAFEQSTSHHKLRPQL